jgi:hypothetical protein
MGMILYLLYWMHKKVNKVVDFISYPKDALKNGKDVVDGHYR